MRIHEHGLSEPRREDGAVAVVVAIFAAIFVVLLAFTTDFGMAYAQRQALATGVDSAALAIVQAKYVAAMGPTHPSCDDLVRLDPGLDGGEAKTIAMARINDNKPFTVASAPTDVTVTPLCDSSSKTYQVTVKINRTIDSIFGQVAGISSMHVDRTAMAALGVANQVRGLEPFGMCNNQALNIIANKNNGIPLPTPLPNPYPAQLVKETKVWTGAATQCHSGGSGNWGWIGFPGMGNDSTGLGDMLKSGYDGAVTVDPTQSPPVYYNVGTVPGGRANNAHTQGAMKALLNTIVTFPVFDQVTGGGDTAIYRVMGFITVRLCGFDGITSGPNGTCYDPITNPMVSANDMQVRYVDSTLDESQPGKTACAIGATCAFNAYTYKLQRVDGSPQP